MKKIFIMTDIKKMDIKGGQIKRQIMGEDGRNGRK
jgi:hypothetical protein